MATRLGWIPLLLAVAGTAAVLAPGSGAARRASGPAELPTLYVQYTMNCTFSIVDDFGHAVSTIAPGMYQVEVSTPIMFKLVVPAGQTVQQSNSNDFTGCKGWVQFQLTGPGVNLFTTLDSGCDAYYTLPATYFKPSSTFTAVDLNQPAVAHATFSTSATGSPQLPASPYGPTSGKGQASTDLVGSDINAPVRATLSGLLGKSGRLTLTSKGKSVSVLKAGRYTFAVTDDSAKAGVTLQPASGTPVILSGVSFVGTHRTTIALKPGRYSYFSKHGPAYYFLVTS